MMNSMSALFLMFLIIDFVSAFILILLGTLAGIYVFNLTTSVLIIAPGIVSMNGMIATFIAAFVIGGIFARNNEIIRREKLQTLHALSANVAHEFRTPLAAIKFAMSGLQRYLPKLLIGYRKAQQANLAGVPKIRNNNILLLENLPSGIEKLVYQANLSIDMMLMNATQLKLSQMDFTKINIYSCLENALQQYPFKSPQHKNAVHIDSDFKDFKCIGSELLVIHIFFNLLKNSLYYIDASCKGEIYIWSQQTSKLNKLYFRDTAQGIAPEAHKNLFKQFHSNREGGTGVGLSFCKTVMEAMNGDIYCESKYGEHATFILDFPRV